MNVIIWKCSLQLCSNGSLERGFFGQNNNVMASRCAMKMYQKKTEFQRALAFAPTEYKSWLADLTRDVAELVYLSKLHGWIRADPDIAEDFDNNEFLDKVADHFHFVHLIFSTDMPTDKEHGIFAEEYLPRDLLTKAKVFQMDNSTGWLAQVRK